MEKDNSIKALSCFALSDVNGRPSLKNASARPETPIPTGRWRLFDTFASGIGYLFTSIILFKLRVTILVAL